MNVDQVVRLTRALSNPDGLARLQGASKVRRRALAESAGSINHPAYRLRAGAIQAAVLDVLGDADGSLRPNEVRQQVEQRLGRAVSIDTVSSFLSVAARSDNWRVVRTSYGRYGLCD